jgi:2-polyprenyl-3-methyl-5-hydroxy-6-metoxy-1,4-benzoquinol methylase
MSNVQQSPADLRRFYEEGYERNFNLASIPSDDDFMYGQVLGQLRPYLRPGLRVLDLGCNNGTLSLYMARHGCDVLGIDLARNIVDTAERSAAVHGIANARFRAMDFLAEWDQPDAFDLVLCSHVIEHVPDDEAFLRKICYSLKPSGRLVLLTPTSHSSLVLVHKLLLGEFRHDKEVGHLRRYTGRMLRQRMEAAGLQVRKIARVDSVLREWAIVFRPFRPLTRILARRYVRQVLNAADQLLADCFVFPSAVCVHAERRE